MSNLTPRQRYLLTKLIGECSEVIQIAAKTLQYGFDSHNPDTNRSNKMLLEMELGDVRCFEELLIESGCIDDSEIQFSFNKKYHKEVQAKKTMP